MLNSQNTIDLVRDVRSQQRQIDNLIQPEISRYLVTPFLDLPGKVGIWYAGDVQRSTGDLYDASGQGRTLTYNGNPTFNQLSNGIAYCDYDGTGDYHARADETDLDVTGTETINATAVQGLTMGVWVNADDISTSPVIISKFLNPVNQSYLMQFLSTGVIRFAISATGAATHTSDTTATYSAGTWLFIVMRFIPSTEKSIFVNNVKETDTSSIPASIFSGAAPLEVASFGAGALVLNGKISITFLCHQALPDGMIRRLFNQTRVFFGV